MPGFFCPNNKRRLYRTFKKTDFFISMIDFPSLGFTPRKASQLLQAMKLQLKQIDKNERHIGTLIRKKVNTKVVY